MKGTRRSIFENWGRQAVVTASLGVAGLAAGAVRADEMKFPPNHPEVAMEIPAGWKIEKRSDGVEMISPEKNSIIVANIVHSEKATIDAWAKSASEKLQAFGIAFDKNAKAPPPKVGAVAPTKAEAPPVSGSSAFTTDPNVFTFAGKPSLAMPGLPNSNDPVLPAETSVETLTNFGTTVTAPKIKLPFHAVQYYGTTLNGKPVDVQLVVYTLPDKRFFLMMQESGSDDGRAVAIAQSVHTIK